MSKRMFACKIYAFMNVVYNGNNVFHAVVNCSNMAPYTCIPTIAFSSKSRDVTCTQHFGSSHVDQHKLKTATLQLACGHT